MSTTITFRRGTAAPTQAAGLTLGEPAFDTTNRNLYVGLGSGVTAAWVGARISGLSSDIAAGLTNWIVNAKAVKDYVAVTTGSTTFATDISVNSLRVGRGPGDSSTNTVLGFGAIAGNSGGGYLTAVGFAALNANVDGNNNTAIGSQSLYQNVNGFYLTALGDAAFRNLSGGSGSIAIGSDAARYYGSGVDALDANSNSVFLGYNTRAGADATNNEIVIGASAIGNGSNSTTIGTAATTLTRLYGVVWTNGGISAAGATFSSNVSIGATLTVSGNLIVDGTTTTINSTIISVDDKNIVLADIDTPSDTAADGGGITLKGSSDKNLYWKRLGGSLAAEEVANSWNTNQNFNLTSATGKYYVEAYEVLSKTALGSTVVSSSLTSVGTITSGTWNSDIVYVDGGTYT
jgi:hypothetical protein